MVVSHNPVDLVDAVVMARHGIDHVVVVVAHGTVDDVDLVVVVDAHHLDIIGDAFVAAQGFAVVVAYEFVDGGDIFVAAYGPAVGGDVFVVGPAHSLVVVHNCKCMYVWI